METFANCKGLDARMSEDDLTGGCGENTTQYSFDFPATAPTSSPPASLAASLSQARRPSGNAYFPRGVTSRLNRCKDSKAPETGARPGSRSPAPERAASPLAGRWQHPPGLGQGFRAGAPGSVTFSASLSRLPSDTQIPQPRGCGGSGSRLPGSGR